MSKHIYWFALAAAGLFAAACSDNDALDSSSAVSDGSSTFMAVNIYMTSDAATRSSSTVSGGGFSTGSTAEYAIDLENSSVFLFYDSNGDFLTSTTEVTSKGGAETSGTDLTSDYVEYTYSAMLVLGPTTLTPTYVVGIFNDAKAQTAYDGLSLDKLKEALFNSDNELTATDDNAGILMSNAVKYDEGSFSFATEISKDNICSTSDAALESPVEMYIERAKAKVEIGIEDNFTSNENGTYTYTIKKTGDNSKTDSTFTYYYVDGESGEIIPVTGATVDITINGWAVNALNKTGYVIKNYSNDGTELSSDITSSSKGGAWGSDWYSSFRIFWAVDGNYAAEASEDEDRELQYTTWATVKEAGCSTDGAYYYEQTLDPNATTGYIAGKTAYAPTLLVAATVGVNAGDDVSEADDSSDDANDIFIWYGSVLYSKQAVYARILSTLSSIEELSLSEDETISSIEWETDDASKGSVYIKSITMSNNTDVSTYIDQVNSSSSLINYSEETSSSSTLRRYNGGACYYQVPIQTYISTSSTTDHPYGLVRNTAYSITINSVTGIGGGVNDPDEEELTEIPGEDTNYCIGARVNVLAWRLSTQSVDL